MIGNVSAKNNFLNEITVGLSSKYGTGDLQIITNIILTKLDNYEISEKTTELMVVNAANEKLLKRFLATKKVEGRSEKTLNRYNYILGRMLASLNIPLEEVDVYALRLYLANLGMNGNKDNTVNGIRWIVCSFFKWLHNEGYVKNDPTINLQKIKCKKEIKTPFNKIEIEKLKAGCDTKRNRAIIEFLLSTGCRISEMTNVNIADVNFHTQECKILGKGNKERIVFINDVCLMHLQDYLKERHDQSLALFIGKGTERISPGGIRFMLRKTGVNAGVNNVHPHRFRRTVATSLIDRGMSVQDVAVILGHSNINTTMTYVYSNLENVKSAYKKYSM